MSDRSKNQEFVAWIMSDASAFEMQTPYFNQSNLLKRGWSKGLIKRLLGKRDWADTNPHGDGFSEMLCWRADRVLTAEATPDFQQHVASKKRRQRRADEQMLRKRLDARAQAEKEAMTDVG